MYDADWYSRVMVEEGSPAMLPLEESPWLILYLEAAKLIDPHEHVVDLGCGTGRFIQQLYERGHYAPVTGVDWALAPLEEAIAYCQPPSLPHASLPTFEPISFEEWQPDNLRAGNTVYTCLEVLEHLDDDLALIRKIPPAHRFIFSVPSYYSESHVRWFEHVSEVWERYQVELNLRRWAIIDAGGTRHIHLLEARRRKDSWA